jgi:hypothetical protein
MGDAQVGRRGGSAKVWDPHIEELLRDWQQRVTAARTAHYALASRLRRSHLLLGIPAVVFSSVVGTSLFATLTKEKVNSTLRLVIGAVSVLAAIFAALQTFLRFGERAEKHVIAADWYSAIRREIAEILALPAAVREHPKECLDRIRKEMSKISQQSPEIGDRLWAKLSETYGVDDSAPMGRGSTGTGDSPSPSAPAATPDS